jgi:uncharacterized protein YbbK (DUF523 family)
MGAPVRYDGAAKPLASPHLQRWRDEGRLVPFCPEVAAGLATPREPAEIAPGGDGAAVIAGRARVLTRAGADVTAAFRAGAELALRTALAEGCRFALLIDGSPSCGARRIHDGTFAGRRVAAAGVTATLLAEAGIAVFTSEEINALAAALARAG